MLVEFYDPKDDDQFTADMSDTRRPRFTLRHLNKLRKMRDIQAVDRKEYLLDVQHIYGAASDSDSEEF